MQSNQQHKVTQRQEAPSNTYGTADGLGVSTVDSLKQTQALAARDGVATGGEHTATAHPPMGARKPIHPH